MPWIRERWVHSPASLALRRVEVRAQAKGQVKLCWGSKVKCYTPNRFQVQIQVEVEVEVAHRSRPPRPRRPAAERSSAVVAAAHVCVRGQWHGGV
jgi:hypothetical protein